jgi:hypothetical protein
MHYCEETPLLQHAISFGQVMDVTAVARLRQLRLGLPESLSPGWVKRHVKVVGE